MKKVLTLCIVQKDDNILLGMKKRGFGMGNWNGFGGKVEKNELIENAAKRELYEEARITVIEIENKGLLEFAWEGQEETFEVHVFKVTHFAGEPQETEEMKPQWFSIKDIPYDNMWDDDKYWLPLFLENKYIKGTFLFNKENNVIQHTLI